MSDLRDDIRFQKAFSTEEVLLTLVQRHDRTGDLPYGELTTHDLWIEISLVAAALSDLHKRIVKLEGRKS